MILVRTPLRISIGGGGSDLPSYYRRFGSFFISAAIDKYVYIGINKTFTNEYSIRYSSQERVTDPAEIRHPIIREALRLHRPGPLEVVSLADIPAGTGLGSSGTFTVGLLRALYAFKRELVTTSSLAEEACHIEMDLLQEPVGKQDQYIAAFGGITCFEIDTEGRVQVSPLGITNKGLHDLEDHLMLFFTVYSRSASTLLADQKTKILLNLADVDYIDSSGIGELVSGYTAVKNQGGDLKLLHLTKKVRDLLQITKLYTVFDVYSDENAALGSFR